MVQECNYLNTGKAAFIDLYSLTKMWSRGTQRLKMKPQQYDIIVGIINEQHHWKLAVIYPREKKTLFLDPLGGHSCEGRDAMSQGGSVRLSHIPDKGMQLELSRILG
ncbi:hypothetical protein N1851_031013 [Merluccius polli]|uniref:Ubiquitin-like protease family profile domain-containing protein n=1 Tax=Merluccius polli TaxID=89951 RepID=A0AA47NQC2_MERPO|nr:hypothetical protein N1851_031013 [Merluccius polli]